MLQNEHHLPVVIMRNEEMLHKVKHFFSKQAISRSRLAGCILGSR